MRRVFELFALGYGKRRIGRTLNDAGTVSPRAQRGRPTGWAPSSVLEVLNGPIYRGEIVWNATDGAALMRRRHLSMNGCGCRRRNFAS